MQLKNRHIFSKSILVLMMLLLCLPCSVKQEVKLALDIPISNLDSSAKPNQLVTCQNLTQDVSQTYSIPFQKKEIQSLDYTSFIDFQLSTVSYRYEAYTSKNDIPSTVPIYILHEQYLI
jgi:hypothetical protein